MTRVRNEELHAEIERIVDLKLQIPHAKAVAARFNSTTKSVRALISRRLKARKSTNVNIPRGTNCEKLTP